MPRPRNHLMNMEIDEISLVDKGANQHAMITIAKRAPEEDEMPDLYSQDGSPVDENALTDGDIVFDEEGNAYQFNLGGDEDQPGDDTGEETEPDPLVHPKKKEEALVGKSAFFNNNGPVRKSVGDKTFADEIREQLSKAFTDDDRDEVLSKAFGKIEELEREQRAASEIAKAERDLRLTREYVSKAAEYNLPVDPNELGPVLYRMAENMSYDDCSVIAKCLEAAGDLLFTEVGFQGGGDNNDVLAMVTERAQESITKSAGDNAMSLSKAVSDVFEANPEAYDEYLSDQRSRL